MQPVSRLCDGQHDAGGWGRRGVCRGFWILAGMVVEGATSRDGGSSVGAVGNGERKSGNIGGQGKMGCFRLSLKRHMRLMRRIRHAF